MNPADRPPGSPPTPAIPLGELAERMGIHIVELTDDRAIARMPVSGNRQPYGLLHGGATAALAETLGSVHAAHLAPAGKVPVGIELSCSHHRAAREGEVVATSRPIHRGNRLSSFEITVTDITDRRIASARLSVLNIDTPTQAG